MPNNELVVSDTSPLLNLALIDQLTLLKSQFSSITIPRQVWNELTDGEAGVDALRSLHDDAFLSITEVKQSPSSLKSSTSWILAKQSRHCAGADIILLDEKDGRQVARRHDLTVTGVIGILLRGANAGNIELKHELDALRDAGFWISDDLYSKVLSESTE